MSKNIELLKMQQESSAILISIHPKYVSKILDGTKKVEFRRVWAARKVTHLVIYSTSPEMKVTAIAEIDNTVMTDKKNLWNIAQEYGGGVTKKELIEYFDGVSKGHAVFLKKIQKFIDPIPLSEIFPQTRPPQSYIYLTAEQFQSAQQNILLEA